MSKMMEPLQVIGPWKGIITDQPSGFDNQAADGLTNIMSRFGRLQSRPKLTPFSAAPTDGFDIRGMYSFLDVTDSWHTLILTRQTAYFITNPSGTLVYNALVLPAGMSDLGEVNLPYAIVETGQKVFFSNGARPIMYVDGSQKCQIAGDVPGGCQFLAENSNYLIGVNWTIPAPGIENSTNYPFRVQISDANNPNEWVPSTSNSALIINLIEKGGVPCGITTLANYTYVWRQYGANVLWPTGNATQAFQNEPFTWSNPGWGNFYPYTIATWNQVALMVTHAGEVLMFNGASGPTATGFQPLASGKILSDLAYDLSRPSGTTDPVMGFVTDQLGPGFPFNAYVIWIPGLNKAWVLNLFEMTWSVWFVRNGEYLTAFGNIKVH